MQTLTTSIQKLPGGGYVMAYAVDGQSLDGQQAHAACSTLIEVYDQIHNIARQSMQEAPVRPVQPPQPPAPQSQPQFDMRERLPHVLEDMANPRTASDDPSLVNKITRAMGNGRASALIFAALVTLALAANSMGIRA
ncbi:MAG: hypothetical protein K2X43_01060 [Hyphomonadaceae bacterium]|jgi:hypothetical protein|nr:hypothetical protein [Hyphomonadaceae bacterium]